MFGMRTSLLSAARSAPWLPGTAQVLARRKWGALHADLGLTPEEYSTSRILARSASAPRRVAARVTAPAEFGICRPVLLEDLRPCDAYDAIGLRLAALDDGDRTAAVAGRLRDALDVVAQVPSLAAAVGGVLSAVHVLETPGPDHDVSYSDPAVPFSAFVGVPDADGPVATLRLAEGLVHEAMHLQLTLVEAAAPLVSGEAERHWTPWQATRRPTRGVLHGFYVFRVLHGLFGELSAVCGDTTVLGHVDRRQRDIELETGDAAGSLARSEELTPLGRQLLEALLPRDCCRGAIPGPAERRQVRPD